MGDTLVEDQVRIPTPGVEDSPRHLLFLGLSAFTQWTDIKEVKEALATDEIAVRIVKHLIGDLKDAMHGLVKEPARKAG